MMNQEPPHTDKLERTKVLFLITKATFGGAQRYVYDLASNLPQNEYEAGVAYGIRGRLTDMLETHGIPVLEIPSLRRNISPLSDIKSYFEIRDAIRAATPDILHVNSSKAAALGALAGRIHGVKTIIFTAHGWPFKESRDVFSQAALFLISWFTGLLATHVIVVSKTDERIGARMPWVRKKLVHIPLGRENLNLAAPQEAFREMFGGLPIPPITQKTVRIVSIAELTKNKGLRYGVEAIAELTSRGLDCLYVIASDGEEHDRLTTLARELGVADRVFLSGFIPDAARYLSGFDVYLLPSIKEGMPYVLIEASLAGLQIVATTVIDQEFADALGRTTLVPPRNSLALADAIEGLATLSRNSVAAENRFPLPDMISKTLALYEQGRGLK
jgi:glycosyltransferase involved in cell wall biosynthesis